MKMVSVSIAFLVLVSSVRAGDDFKPEAGYTSLFNGKDLTGWRFGKIELADQTSAGPKKQFSVQDGIIVVGPGGGDLYTVKEFNTDFHLKLQFRAAPKADSGVHIRGKQLQVRDYPTAGPYKKVKFNAGDWNDLDITVTGKTAECKCNGEVIEAKFGVPEKGAIGLQSESGKFEYRRIRVKEMK